MQPGPYISEHLQNHGRPMLQSQSSGQRACEKVRLMFFLRLRRANMSDDTSSLALLAKGVTQNAT